MFKIIIDGKRTKENKIYVKLYGLWYNMKQRCTNPKHPRYKDYGGCGVKLCVRWMIFDNFVEDVDKIEGFLLDKLINGEICLDKDKKSGSKLYSLETCVFISKEENNHYKPNQQREVIGISPQGEKYKFTNQSQFAREHNLTQSGISSCLSGKCKTHRKWKFLYK